MHADSKDHWPANLDEAVEHILERMSPRDRALVSSTPRDQLGQFHQGWGMGIRNALGLWEGNSALKESCGSPRMDADEASGVIMEGVWYRLHGHPADDARIGNWHPPVHPPFAALGTDAFTLQLLEGGMSRETAREVVRSAFYLNDEEVAEVLQRADTLRSEIPSISPRRPRPEWPGAK